jgi:CheY-like chemotaxis protein
VGPVRKLKIMLVEDDLDIADAMTDVLTDHGHEVQSARNGKEALTLLSTGTLPHLIFLDLMMPLMDGAQFREAQLRDERLAKIPVVVLSADRNVEARALELGVEGWLPKPTTPQKVLEAAERYSTASA